MISSQLLRRSKPTLTLFLALLLEWDLVGRGECSMVNNNPYNRLETLDPQGKYQLEWLVDHGEKCITFNVTVKTRGYVGFGLSQNGKMAGADIVIGGVFPNGTKYFSDRHAVGNHIPELDPSQDWKLLSAWENRSHTFLSFSRAFDTCDPQDYQITEDRIALIWSYGEIDDIEVYHYQNRGLFNIHLLHREYSPHIIHSSSKGNEDVQVVGREKENLKVWSLPSRIELSADHDTTYWCTMYKAPRLQRKHHSVGFDLVFANEMRRRHVHHLIVFKCHAPPGYSATSLFGPFVGPRGQQCFGMGNPAGPMPTEYCTEAFDGTAIGGRAYFKPPHVGLPFGESEDEYYVVQTHYDNPDMLEDLLVELRVDIFYTDKLREFEGGLMQLRVQTPGITPSILVPPSTPSQRVFTHCGSECTQRMFPKEGITIYALLLHAHNSARKIRLQHFRKNEELPWIVNDDNYAFNFQQFRVLPEERKILPGDQLTTQCVYDNTWTNGTVLGGFSSRMEMCASWVNYYTRIPHYQICSSQIISDSTRENLLGFTNITLDYSELEFVVDAPHPLAGQTVSQISDNHIEWDLRARANLQRVHLKHPQVNTCPQELFVVDAPPRSFPRNKHYSFINPDDFSATVEYPFNAKPYRPQEAC